jgi:hypothetical protein
VEHQEASAGATFEQCAELCVHRVDLCIEAPVVRVDLVAGGGQHLREGRRQRRCDRVGVPRRDPVVGIVLHHFDAQREIQYAERLVGGNHLVEPGPLEGKCGVSQLDVQGGLRQGAQLGEAGRERDGIRPGRNHHRDLHLSVRDAVHEPGLGEHRHDDPRQLLRGRGAFRCAFAAAREEPAARRGEHGQRREASRDVSSRLAHGRFAHPGGTGVSGR